MKDFENKKIKIIYNLPSGSIVETGSYLKMEAGFIVYIDDFSKKVKYACLTSVKNIEIVGEVHE